MVLIKKKKKKGSFNSMHMAKYMFFLIVFIKENIRLKYDGTYFTVGWRLECFIKSTIRYWRLTEVLNVICWPIHTCASGKSKRDLRIWVFNR